MIGVYGFDAASFVATLDDAGVVPLATVLARLPVHGLGALMCVETAAAACHRSLVAARLAERFDLQVIELEPPAE